jgi:hypothetical protein
VITSPSLLAADFHDVSWSWSVLFGSNNLHNHVVKFPSTAFLPLTPITCTKFSSLNSVVGNVPLHNIGAVKSMPPNVNLKCAVYMFLTEIKTKVTDKAVFNG